MHLNQILPWSEVDAATEAIACLDEAIREGKVGKIKCNEKPDELKRTRDGLDKWVQQYRDFIKDKERPVPGE